MTGLTFGYPTSPDAAKAAPPAQTQAQANQELEGQAQSKAEQPDSAPAAAPAEGGVFFMQGEAADEAIAQAEATQQSNRDKAGEGFRFFCPPGEERRITFLDGNLRPDGRLALTVWWEHRIPHAGAWTEVFCMPMSMKDKNLPCPVCDANLQDYQSQLVCGLTVINHTPHTVTKGQNQGKVLEHRRQLFIGPKTIIPKLMNIAVKEGGLQFKSFDVSRAKKLDARTGDQFYKVGEQTPEALVELLGEEVLKPTDWSKVCVPMTDEQIAQLTLSPLKQTGTASVAAPF